MFLECGTAVTTKPCSVVINRLADELVSKGKDETKKKHQLNFKLANDFVSLCDKAKDTNTPLFCKATPVENSVSAQVPFMRRSSRDIVMPAVVDNTYEFKDDTIPKPTPAIENSNTSIVKKHIWRKAFLEDRPIADGKSIEARVGNDKEANGNIKPFVKRRWLIHNAGFKTTFRSSVVSPKSALQLVSPKEKPAKPSNSDKVLNGISKPRGRCEKKKTTTHNPTPLLLKTKKTLRSLKRKWAFPQEYSAKKKREPQYEIAVAKTNGKSENDTRIILKTRKSHIVENLPARKVGKEPAQGESPAPKTKKVSALSIYSKLDGVTISEISCKRFRKRFKRKTKSTENSKDSASSFEYNVLDTVLTRHESVAQTVRETVDYLTKEVLNRNVYTQDSFNLDTVSNDLKDLVYEFCSENGFCFADFGNLEDLLTFKESLAQSFDSGIERANIGMKRKRRRRTGFSTCDSDEDDNFALLSALIRSRPRARTNSALPQNFHTTESKNDCNTQPIFDDVSSEDDCGKPTISGNEANFDSFRFVSSDSDTLPANNSEEEVLPSEANINQNDGFQIFKQENQLLEIVNEEKELDDLKQIKEPVDNSVTCQNILISNVLSHYKCEDAQNSTPKLQCENKFNEQFADVSGDSDSDNLVICLDNASSEPNIASLSKDEAEIRYTIDSSPDICMDNLDQDFSNAPEDYSEVPKTNASSPLTADNVISQSLYSQEIAQNNDNNINQVVSNCMPLLDDLVPLEYGKFYEEDCIIQELRTNYTSVEANNDTVMANNDTVKTNNANVETNNATVDANNVTVKANNATDEDNKNTLGSYYATSEAKNTTFETLNCTVEANNSVASASTPNSSTSPSISLADGSFSLEKKQNILDDSILRTLLQENPPEDLTLLFENAAIENLSNSMGDLSYIIKNLSETASSDDTAGTSPVIISVRSLNDDYTRNLQNKEKGLIEKNSVTITPTTTVPSTHSRELKKTSHDSSKNVRSESPEIVEVETVAPNPLPTPSTTDDSKCLKNMTFHEMVKSLEMDIQKLDKKAKDKQKELVIINRYKVYKENLLKSLLKTSKETSIIPVNLPIPILPISSTTTTMTRSISCGQVNKTLLQKVTNEVGLIPITNVTKEDAKNIALSQKETCLVRPLIRDNTLDPHPVAVRTERPAVDTRLSETSETPSNARDLARQNHSTPVPYKPPASLISQTIPNSSQTIFPNPAPSVSYFMKPTLVNITKNLPPKPKHVQKIRPKILEPRPSTFGSGISNIHSSNTTISTTNKAASDLKRGFQPYTTSNNTPTRISTKPSLNYCDKTPPNVTLPMMLRATPSSDYPSYHSNNPLSITAHAYNDSVKKSHHNQVNNKAWPVNEQIYAAKDQNYPAKDQNYPAKPKPASVPPVNRININPEILKKSFLSRESSLSELAFNLAISLKEAQSCSTQPVSVVPTSLPNNSNPNTVKLQPLPQDASSLKTQLQNMPINSFDFFRIPPTPVNLSMWPYLPYTPTPTANIAPYRFPSSMEASFKPPQTCYSKEKNTHESHRDNGLAKHHRQDHINKISPLQYSTSRPNSKLPIDPNTMRFRKCMVCNQADAQFICSGCGKDWYCSVECQRENWKVHSRVCST